jgi:hypothetical protein
LLCRSTRRHEARNRGHGSGDRGRSRCLVSPDGAPVDPGESAGAKEELAHSNAASAALQGGDSGELAAEGCQLGVAHPPGYPLIVWLYWIVSRGHFASWGSPAFRMNCVSALLGGFAAWMTARFAANLVYILRGPTRVAQSMASQVLDGLVGATAGALWGTMPLVWYYNIGAEVFALNNALAAAMLAIMTDISLAAIHKQLLDEATAKKTDTVVAPTWGSTQWLVCLGSLVAGLALANQHTSVLFIAAIMPVIAVQIRLWNDGALMVWATVALLTGLSPYVWIYIAHATPAWKKPGSWGSCGTLAGFWRHITRADYGTFQLYSGEAKQAESFSQRTWAFVKELAFHQFPTARSPAQNESSWQEPSIIVGAPADLTLDVSVLVFGLALAGLGMSVHFVATNLPRVLKGRDAVLRHQVCTVLATVGALALYLGVFHSLSNMPLKNPLLYGVHARFWMQPSIVVAVLVAIGVVQLSRRLGAERLSGLSLLGVLTAVVASTVLRFHRMDHSQDTIMYDYGKQLLAGMPLNATVVTAFDFQWTAARYVHVCEGFRPDLSLLNGPMMSFDWFRDHRELYPSTAFPGTHLVKRMTQPHADGGFTWEDFVEANVLFPAASESDLRARMKRKYQSLPFKYRHDDVSVASTARNGALVIAGEPTHWAEFQKFLDSDSATVSLLPLGLSSVLVPRANALDRELLSMSVRLMEESLTHFALRFLDHSMSDDTWERATDLESWNRLEGAATALLERSIDERASFLDGMVTSLMVLQTVEQRLEMRNSTVPTSMLKNAGLACTRIVKTPGELSVARILPLNATGIDDLRFNAAMGVVRYWGAFLARPDARSDSGFAAISGVMEHLSRVTNRRG